MGEPRRTAIYRRDYAPSSHLIETVDLRLELGERVTSVRARLHIKGNPDANAGAASADLTLHGERLALREVRIDGAVLAEAAYEVDARQLTLLRPPDEFVLETTVEIKPQENTTLEGLYRSSGNFCTQCEAEGFRRITYFLDRPDVLARYTTTIVADSERYPVLLSNGNRVDSGTLDGGRHYVKWQDPFPKPSYLFALVAGQLQAHTGSFTTRSGRERRLEIWVEPQNLGRCEHALRSLRKAMQWDEEVYGLEYDLELFMIVAVNDFNAGAMENKGLNLFNSQYVLADPLTATDDEYQRIEGVIAHEYFHNWTGNRVTCRDWFQLTLKEGLTVFRDQQFTADMTSPAFKRINDVRLLRRSQFAEDAGPMAHPIRPESYLEMNNFYTVTVYEKGAEVIRMYHTLLGADGFRRGMDLYFERHDGSAVTCDDFRSAMADANGVELNQFEQWYLQRGTPRLRVTGAWDAAEASYRLTLRQDAGDSLGAEPYQLRHMPVRVGLLGPDGEELALDAAGSTSQVLELREVERTWELSGITRRPVASVLRDFSAPVQLIMSRPRDELAFLMAHDRDAFNRWDAGETFAQLSLLDLVAALQAGAAAVLDQAFVTAWGAVLEDAELDGSLKSVTLQLPDEMVVGQLMQLVAVQEVRSARRLAMATLARAYHDALLAHHQAVQGKAYDASAASIHRRRLGNISLAYLCAGDPAEGEALAQRQFEVADNMTDSYAALACLAELPGGARTTALAQFYLRWQADPLVLNKWFSVQAQSGADDTIERVLELAEHPDFTRSNPNRFRALVGGFGLRNQFHFHTSDGRGYRFLADEVLAMDPLNPQTAARAVCAFNQWRRFDERRQALQRAELERIVASDGLSADVYEIVNRALTGS